jgi:murein tripeptide amidase MpaA
VTAADQQLPRLAKSGLLRTMTYDRFLAPSPLSVRGPFVALGTAMACTTMAWTMMAGVAAMGCAARASVAPAALRTTGETTDYVATGSYDEALQLCRDFALAYPGKARCDRFGQSAQGRPLVTLTVSRAGALTPEAARRERRPVIVIEGGIHAGEIDGKDAGFAFLRDWLDGKVAAESTAATVVFVPVINPDGHERRTANNRPNQRGPKEMGFRTNGQNLNLNRDFLKADTSEIRALLTMVNRWDPEVFVDLHTTDGAKFQHDIAVMVSPQSPRSDQLDDVALEISGALQSRLTALGHLPVPFYPSFITDGDPTSGFTRGDAPPRFSTPYTAERGRIGILVETHSWRTYKERVRSTYHTLQALLEFAATAAPRWRSVADQLDREMSALGGTEVTLLWDVTKTSQTIDFRGYRYEKVPSEISGAQWIRYDETQAETWRVPLFAELAPSLIVKAPARGYIVHGGFAAAVRTLLDAHGIRYRVLDSQPTASVGVYRATKVGFDPPYEGRTRVRLEGSWTGETRTLDVGSIFVPIAQPRARLILHLFEPSAPDSLVAWGQFNSVFEQKEYMEAYVAEEVAREMLAREPSLRAAFDQAIAADPEMAKSPAKRLDFFYRRHPSWDERMNLVPVFRLEAQNAAIEGTAAPASGAR